MRTYATRNAGFTAIEAIIAVAIIGIILAVGVVQLRPPSTRLFANDLKALLQQAKNEAVKRNVPVAVVWDGDAGRFETRVSDSIASPCNGTTVVAVQNVADYRNLTVATDIGTGVVWLPNGQGQTCARGTNIASDTTITDGRTTRTVSIRLGGSVEIQ